MLFFNKLLPVFVLPIGIVTLLVLLAAWKKWRWAAIVAVLVLLASSTGVVANLLLRPLENAYPARSIASVSAADAVLVLGGVMSPGKEVGLVTEWSEAVERFEAGVEIVQRDKARMLLFTGDPRGSEGSALQREAIERGVPRERTAVIGAVGNTADEAEQLRRYAAQHGLKRVLLVTSAWHLPRAMRLFRSAGVEITAFPVDYRALPSRTLPYLDWIPNAGSLGKTELALRECYGMAFYAVFGK
ncbi:MAG: YdcF family protein [Opitutae bacterium]|nr:YdcF family protein [Opitutae bacterium]